MMKSPDTKILVVSLIILGAIGFVHAQESDYNSGLDSHLPDGTIITQEQQPSDDQKIIRFSYARDISGTITEYNSIAGSESVFSNNLKSVLWLKVVESNISNSDCATIWPGSGMATWTKNLYCKKYNFIVSLTTNENDIDLEEPMKQILEKLIPLEKQPIILGSEIAKYLPNSDSLKILGTYHEKPFGLKDGFDLISFSYTEKSGQVFGNIRKYVDANDAKTEFDIYDRNVGTGFDEIPVIHTKFPDSGCAAFETNEGTLLQNLVCIKYNYYLKLITKDKGIDLDSMMSQMLQKISTPSKSDLEEYLPDKPDIVITETKSNSISFSYQQDTGHVEGSITKYKDAQEEKSNFNAAALLTEAKVDYNKYPQIDCATFEFLSKNHMFCRVENYHLVVTSDEKEINLQVPIEQMVQKIKGSPQKPNTSPEEHASGKPSIPNRGNGCLIATAIYGTELAPQVQMLREIRDNVLFSTNSGTAFMTGFNEFYYSFSPTIADFERQNPAFRELVRIVITPMLSTLSILNFVDIDSESEMLGYGIGVILLNILVYFAAPVILVIRLKSHLRFKSGSVKPASVLNV